MAPGMEADAAVCGEVMEEELIAVPSPFHLPLLLLLKTLSPPLLPLPWPEARLTASLPPLMPQGQLIFAIESSNRIQGLEEENQIKLLSFSSLGRGGVYYLVLTFVLIRQGLRGRSGRQLLIRALTSG